MADTDIRDTVATAIAVMVAVMDTTGITGTVANMVTIVTAVTDTAAATDTVEASTNMGTPKVTRMVCGSERRDLDSGLATKSTCHKTQRGSL